MPVRRRLLLVLAVLVVVVVAGITYGLAPLVRWIAVAQIHALTDRPTAIDSIALNLFTGRVSVRGVQITERDGTTPFAGIEQLDVRLRLPPLLMGHIWIRDLRVAGSTVRVVRLPGGRFNFSDIIDRPRSPGRALDLTVDQFTLSDSRVSLEDRALPEPRTWTSEHMTVEAHDVSTRHAHGRASAHSVTAGAPLAVELREFRLYPIHLIATVQSEGVDLSPLGLYLPPDAPVVLARGRATSAITVALDARAGLRVDGTVHVEDVALVRPDGGDPLALVPALDVHVAGFSAREGSALQLDRLTVDGALRVRDPAPGRRERYPLSRVRATVADLTWPVTTPGRLDALTTIPGGGTLSLAGTLRPPPEATQLRLRLASVKLAPWAQLVPLPAQVTGVAEADLRMNEPLDTGVPAHVQGTIAVSQLALADGRQEIASARRIEARGLELHWPTRLVVSRVLISSPRGTIERDRAGIISVTRLASKSTSDAARAPDTAPSDAAPSTSPSSTGAAPSPTTPALAVEVGEVAVRDGRLGWRDAAVSPAAQLAVSELEARLTNAGWPLRAPLGVRAGLRPPGGGHVQLDGRIGVDPITADLKVTTKGAELAPYQAYVPTAARIAGTADLELAVTLPPLAERRASLRGSAALARLDVRDGERTVARVERAAATSLEVDWPERVTIGRLTLTRPWLLVERDADGGLPLRTLLKPTNGKSGNGAPAGAAAANAGPSAGAAPADTMSGRATPLAVRVATLTVEDGGVRVVDHAISPAFAVDVQSTSLRLDGLSTTGAAPARVDLRGRVGASAELVLRGTVAVFEGPLRVDAEGELREFAVPRTNPYLVRQVGWQTREGRLTTILRCRIEGDALSARTDVRVSRLQLARASNQDEAQNRIGLPLGLLITLMKDRRGDITLSFPVGGRLSDPKFEFRDAIWSAVRTVAVNAITAPVSWVGRVHFTPDSRIERIQIDPVLFEPGTATLTAEGDGQVGKLVAFLDQLPDVALTITPVVSAGDAEALKRRALDAALKRLMAESKLSREDAVARLYAKRFPDQLAPADATAMLAALLEQTPTPSAALSELAQKRLQAVRAATKRAGIDEARLVAALAVERPNADSRIEIDVREPEAPRGSKFRDALRWLGIPLKDKDTRE